MPRGIKDYRWIETGCQVWMLEHPSGSRRFAGVVSTNTEGFTWWTKESHFHGETKTAAEARKAVEDQVIPDRAMILRGRKVALEALKRARISAAESEEINEGRARSAIDRG
jgi:hypothetical protein